MYEPLNGFIMNIQQLSVFCALGVCVPLAQAHTVTFSVVESFNQVVYNSSHPTWGHHLHRHL
jgi:ABC-type antimicrobial peptide transport system ATPase subunit